MSLNLHASARAAIQSVNKDIPAQYFASTGYAPNSAGRQVPQYAAPVNVKVQSQPPSGKDLKHMEFLNIQGTTRTIYLYSNPSAINRVDAKGGDLLQFVGFAGQPLDKYLVAAVAERWDVGQNGLITFAGIGNLTVAGAVLDVTSVTSGALELDDVVDDSTDALLFNTYVSALGTGTGGVGTYTLNHAPMADEAGVQISVIDTAGKAGWSKLYCVLQTDRPS